MTGVDSSARDPRKTTATPDAGHTFEITWRSRGSFAVVGEAHQDADYWGGALTLEVRAWSLTEALTKAAALPLNAWPWPDEHDEPSEDTRQAREPSYFCGRCGDTGEILLPLSGDSDPCDCPAATGEPYPGAES